MKRNPSAGGFACFGFQPEAERHKPSGLGTGLNIVTGQLALFRYKRLSMALSGNKVAMMVADDHQATQSGLTPRDNCIRCIPEAHRSAWEILELPVRC